MKDELINVSNSILEGIDFDHTNYWKIINKYINVKNELLYRVYVTHVTLVTYKSLKIARALGLGIEQMKFIEEAGMLHDIGIINVDDEEIGCNGDLPYICHGTEGRKILESNDLPLHGVVAETHTGVGIYKDEIIKQSLPLPERDMLPKTIEEEIISWSDLFFTKNPKKIWLEKSTEEASRSIEEFGKKYTQRFDMLAERYANL